MMKTGGSSIGERIRMMRQAKSLTQEELASRAGLTKGFISQVERNLTSLSVESLLGILDALDQKASVFFDEGFDEKIVFGAGRQGRRWRGSRQRNVRHTRPGRAEQAYGPCAPYSAQPARRRTRRSRTKEKSSASCCQAPIDVMLGLKTYRVRKGECFYFKASKKHYLI